MKTAVCKQTTEVTVGTTEDTGLMIIGNVSQTDLTCVIY